MKLKSIFFTIFTVIILLLGIALCNLYYIPSPEKVKPKIQKFINQEYCNQFKVLDVEKSYNPDLFKEPVGYSVLLEDKNGIKFGKIYIQDNEVQGWITFKGSDIAAEYNKAIKLLR